MVNKFYPKKKRKALYLSCKVPKSFWRRKRKKVEKGPRQIKNLSEEGKEKRCQYHHGWNKNLSEEEKQKKVVYMRNFYLAYKK